LLVLVLVLGSYHGLRSEDAPPKEAHHGVVVVDMAKVFKADRRFNDLRERLRTDVLELEQHGKELVSEAEKLKKQLQAAKEAKNFDEAESVDAKLTRANDELEKFRRDSQKTLLRRESDLYRNTYLYVQEEVKLLSQERNVRLAIRFQSEEIPDAGADPQQILTSINRQVLYQEGLDISEEIIKRVNEKYPPERK
jgi:hypothetical protein